MLAWTEQVKYRGLSEQPNYIRVVTKSCNIHEIDNQINLISDFTVIVHYHNIHLILLSASWVCY